MKRGQINLPVIILTVLAIIVVIASIILILNMNGDKEDNPEDLENFTQIGIEDNPEDLENLTRIDILDDAIDHNLTSIDDTCSDECSGRGLRICIDGGYKICGNFDSDSCYEYSSINNCDSNEICESGSCVMTNNVDEDIEDQIISVSYDFDDIEILLAESFNISKNEDSISNTWADNLLGDSNNLKVTYSTFNLKKQGEIIIEEESYLKVKGANGEKRFLLNSRSYDYDSEGNKILERMFFWSAKQLVGNNVIKNKSLPIESVVLKRKIDSVGNPYSETLDFSDDGLNHSYEFDRYLIDYDWEKIKEIPIDDPETEIVYENLEFRITPRINLPNRNFKVEIDIENPELLGNLTMVNMCLYDIQDNLIQTINVNKKIINDKPKLKKNFHIETEGKYYIKYCESDIKRIDLEVIDFNCEELFEGHNDIDADRINLVFLGFNYENVEQFVNITKEILTFNGNPSINRGLDDIPDKQGNPKYYTRIDWGFFSVEPLKSNKNKFNLWYIDNNFKGNVIEISNGIDLAQNNFCNLSFHADIKIVNALFDGESEYFRSHAVLPSFVNEKNISKDGLRFGSSFNSYPNEGVREYGLLIHESGHSLFGLADEYSETERHNHGYPNCAANHSEAEDWWGDFIGEVDPFYYEYKKIMEENDLIPVKEQDIIIQYFVGGCGLDYGEEGAIKPSKDSIMSDHRTHPIFGSVNRARAEQVLNLFSGV